MVWPSDESIAKAEGYLLTLLQGEGEVIFSHLYDGTRASSDRLATAVGISRNTPPPAVVLSLAAGSLRRQRIVEFHDRSDSDGRCGDFWIVPTVNGRLVIEMAVSLAQFRSSCMGSRGGVNAQVFPELAKAARRMSNICK